MTIGHESARLAGDRVSGADTSLPFRAVAMVVLPIGLSVAMPLYLVHDMPDVGRSNAWMVTLGVMVWGGFRLSALCVSGKPRLFDFFFWLFAYIFMGMAPTIQIRTDEIAQTTPGMDPSLDLPASLVIVLGLVIYEVGRLVAITRSHSSDGADLGGSAASFAPTRVSEVKTVVLTALSLIATLYFLLRIGPSSLLGSRATAFAARSAVWPDPAVRSIVYSCAIYPLLVGAGALAQIRLTGKSPAWRRAGWVGLVLTAAILLFVVNPTSTARYSFGTVLFALAAYVGAVRTPFRVRATMLGSLAGFLLLFPLADAFRNPDGGTLASRSSFFGEYLANADYDAFWQVSNAYMYWLDGLVVPLRQLLGSLLFWVPRAIWPDKPTDTGIVLAQYRGYTFENLSAPMWSEALVNGGIVGVVFLFGILGYFLHRMDSKLTRVMSVGGVWAIAGAIFPVYMTILLRGSLLQATGVVFVTALCIRFVTERSTPAESGQPTYSDSS